MRIFKICYIEIQLRIRFGTAESLNTHLETKNSLTPYEFLTLGANLQCFYLLQLSKI